MTEEEQANIGSERVPKTPLSREVGRGVGGEGTPSDAAFWARIEILDAEADDDVRNGRVRPVTDEFFEQLRALVSRPPAGG